MKSKLFFYTFVCGIIFSGTPAKACDLCSIYSANVASGRAGEGFNIGVAEQFTHFGTLKQDGAKTANPLGQYLDSSISQFFVSYGFLKRYGVQLSVPVISRSFKRADGAGGVDLGSEFGLGDISLSGQFSPYQKTSGRFSFGSHLIGGIKLPTGSSQRLNEELSESDEEVGPPSGIHGHDVALGSGSVDGLVGANIYLSWSRLFLTSDVQYSIRTRGSIQYRFANDLHWSFMPGGYVLLKHTYSLALQANLSGEYKSLDNLAGTPAEDTGITAVYMGPKATWTWKGHLNADVGADLPVSIANTSLQSVPDYRLRMAVSWRF